MDGKGQEVIANPGERRLQNSAQLGAVNWLQVHGDPSAPTAPPLFSNAGIPQHLWRPISAEMIPGMAAGGVAVQRLRLGVNFLNWNPD